MKKGILIFIFLIGSLTSYAQKFNIELRMNPENNQQLEVLLKPSSLIAPVNVQQIVFTIQWSAACNVTLGDVQGFAPLGARIEKNLGEVTNSGVVSQMFFVDGQTPLTTLNPSYLLARIPINGNVYGCTFSVPISYNYPLGNWYMFGAHNNGVVIAEMQGTITNNASNVILPVELLSFTAEKSDNKTALQWESVGEHNLAFYKLERSRDRRSYKKGIASL